MSTAKKHIAPLSLDENGNGKALTFTPDPSRPDDIEFASDFEAVAQTKPSNLQDFIMRLVDHQKNKPKKGEGE